jgi:hypothetical protein
MWKPVKYGDDIEYPFYMHVMGFCMSLSSMIWIPGYAIYYLLTQRGSFRDVSLAQYVVLYLNSVVILVYSFQRLVKGITPDIKSSRSKSKAKSALPKDIQMSESSARLLKNASFLTNNTSSFAVDNP